jgi:hypothetical protein
MCVSGELQLPIAQTVPLPDAIPALTELDDNLAEGPAITRSDAVDRRSLSNNGITAERELPSASAHLGRSRPSPNASSASSQLPTLRSCAN